MSGNRPQYLFELLELNEMSLNFQKCSKQSVSSSCENVLKTNRGRKEFLMGVVFRSVIFSQ